MSEHGFPLAASGSNSAVAVAIRAPFPDPAAAFEPVIREEILKSIGKGTPRAPDALGRLSRCQSVAQCLDVGGHGRNEKNESPGLAGADGLRIRR